jgi:hypothetical protein
VRAIDHPCCSVLVLIRCRLAETDLFWEGFEANG